MESSNSAKACHPGYGNVWDGTNLSGPSTKTCLTQVYLYCNIQKEQQVFEVFSLETIRIIISIPSMTSWHENLSNSHLKPV